MLDECWENVLSITLSWTFVLERTLTVGVSGWSLNDTLKGTARFLTRWNRELLIS